jgi:endonuclease V-like protein UPF0215 family
MKTPATMKFTDEALYESVENEIYCPVIVYIEQEGSCHRLAFATHQRFPERELNVVAKLILPDETLTALLEIIPQYLALCEAEPEAPIQHDDRVVPFRARTVG